MAYDEEVAHRIRAALGDETGVVEKAMFGGLAFLIGGHMSVTANRAGGLMVRCDPARTDELLAGPHVRRMVMRGREMDGWLQVDPAGFDTDAELARWVAEGVAHARSLPPK